MNEEPWPKTRSIKAYKRGWNAALDAVWKRVETPHPTFSETTRKWMCDILNDLYKEPKDE